MATVNTFSDPSNHRNIEARKVGIPEIEACDQRAQPLSRDGRRGGVAGARCGRSWVIGEVDSSEDNSQETRRVAVREKKLELVVEC